MSSRLTLTILSALAIVSVVVAIVDRGHEGQAVRDERRLVPGYTRAGVSGIGIERPASAPVVIRESNGNLVMTKPYPAALDDAVVTELLGTIEVLTYHRSARRSAIHGLDTPRVTLTVALDGKSIGLQLGARVDAIDRVWVGRLGDTHAYLIDGYAARALDRTAAQLRSHRVFYAQPDEVTGVELHAGSAAMVLSGAPLSVHRDGPGKLRMAPAAAARLLALLDGLVLSGDAAALTTPAIALTDPLQIRVLGSHPARSLTDLGPCPGRSGHRRVDTSAGPGCVNGAELGRIAAFLRDPTASYDRHLVGTQPVKTMTIIAGSERVLLRGKGAGWHLADGRAASAVAVRAVLAGLDQPRGAPVVALDASEVVRRVILGGGQESREIHILKTSDGLVARRDAEPLGFVVEPALLTLLSGRALDYRSRELISLEPVSLVEAIARAGRSVQQHVVRGTLLEDWTARVPTGSKASLSAIRTLRQVGARLAAVRFIAAAAAPRHGFKSTGLVVELQFDKPPTAGDGRVSHRIAVGARTKRGCYARLDDDPSIFELDRASCAGLTASWR